MNRMLGWMLLAAVGSGPALAERSKGLTSAVPPYLPRAALLGAYLNQGEVTPQLKVAWEVTLLQTPNDALIAIAELGGGWALALPSGRTRDRVDWRMRYAYQHAVVVGIGYRALYHGGLHWGFHLGTGPLFYGADFDTLPAERAWGGTVEGRVQIGIQVGAFAIGGSLGWAQLYNTRVPQVSAPYTGGPFGGIFVDWRPAPKRD